MKLIFASDSFKGSLTSEDTAVLLDKAAHEVFGECECVHLPVADGGEGTTKAVTGAAADRDKAKAVTGTAAGELAHCKVHDPLMRPTDALLGICGDFAVIECAEASGLGKLTASERDPMAATSYGTGELILAALDRGLRKIYIGLGGSATNDGGMGCAKALGVRFLDDAGNELSGCGRDLASVSSIDMSGMDPRIAGTEIIVMSDVRNPLTGSAGATFVYGPQKGASSDDLEVLEAGMVNYRDVIRRSFGIDCDTIEGTGAAGGLGACMKVFLGAEIRSGVDTVLDLIGFDELLESADLVVTGEGMTDRQSCYGKAISGIGLRAKRAGVPVVALSGSMGPGAMDIADFGVASIMTSVNAPMSVEEAMADAAELYYDAAVRMFSLIKVGMGLGGKE